jgi:hypothetical protein
MGLLCNYHVSEDVKINGRMYDSLPWGPFVGLEITLPRENNATFDIICGSPQAFDDFVAAIIVEHKKLRPTIHNALLTCVEESTPDQTPSGDAASSFPLPPPCDNEGGQS